MFLWGGKVLTCERRQRFNIAVRNWIAMVPVVGRIRHTVEEVD